MKFSSNNSDHITIFSNISKERKPNFVSKKLRRRIRSKDLHILKKGNNVYTIKDYGKLKIIQDLLSTYHQKEAQKQINPTLQRFLDKTKDENEKTCEVCLNSSQREDDIVIQCSVCLEYTHQSCYGSDLLNRVLTDEEKRHWVCSRCTEILKAKFKEDEFKSYLNKISCLFCPKYTGITKKITEFFWAHISCVNWIPDIYFQDNNRESVNMKEIKWTERKCYICKLSIGLTIKCEYGNCNKYFHVTCGMNVGSLYDCNKMKMQIFSSRNEKLRKVFCANHTLKFFQNTSKFLSKDNLTSLIPKKYTTSKNDFYNNDFSQDFSKRKRIPLKLKKLKETITLMKEDELPSRSTKNLLKKGETLERFEGNILNRIETNSMNIIEEEFTDIEKKFYTLIENDMKRVNEKKESILSISTFKKLKDYVKEYVETTNFER